MNGILKNTSIDSRNRNSDKPSGYEEEIIKRVQEGDTEAFRILMKKYFQELTDFAFHYMKSPQSSKDVVQDVFANIWERRSRWDPSRSLKSYLYQSVRNESLKKIRDGEIEKKYLKAYIHEKDIREVISPKSDIDNSNQFKQAVQYAIQELPERARLAYKLHRRDGLTYKEIAQVMDISHRTVESQISRALQILRNKLSPITL